MRITAMDQVSGDGAVKNLSPVEQKLKELNSSIDLLEGVISRLESRLTFVLISKPEGLNMKSSGPDAPSPPCSALENQLQAMRYRTSGVFNRLSSLEDSLAI